MAAGRRRPPGPRTQQARLSTRKVRDNVCPLFKKATVHFARRGAVTAGVRGEGTLVPGPAWSPLGAGACLGGFLFQVRVWTAGGLAVALGQHCKPPPLPEARACKGGETSPLKVAASS